MHFRFVTKPLHKIETHLCFVLKHISKMYFSFFFIKSLGELYKIETHLCFQITKQNSILVWSIIQLKYVSSNT